MNKMKLNKKQREDMELLLRLLFMRRSDINTVEIQEDEEFYSDEIEDFEEFGEVTLSDWYCNSISQTIWIAYGKLYIQEIIYKDPPAKRISSQTEIAEVLISYGENEETEKFIKEKIDEVIDLSKIICEQNKTISK